MPNFTPEVRNGKPSRLTTGLLVASIAFLTSCTPAGRQFINNMGYTAAGTFVQESITKEVWGNGQEVANIQGGVQRHNQNNRMVFYFKGRPIYSENGNSYRTKLEEGKFFRMKDGKWILIPNGTPIFSD